MHDVYTSVVPIGVQRRLILNLCYHLGAQSISEESLDAMSDEAWQTFIAPWLASREIALTRASVGNGEGAADGDFGGELAAPTGPGHGTAPTGGPVVLQSVAVATAARTGTTDPRTLAGLG
jgi:hypothetical protein